MTYQQHNMGMSRRNRIDSHLMSANTNACHSGVVRPLVSKEPNPRHRRWVVLQGKTTWCLNVQ